MRSQIYRLMTCWGFVYRYILMYVEYMQTYFMRISRVIVETPVFIDRVLCRNGGV